MSRLNRRDLLKHSVVATAAATFVPNLASGEVAKNDKLNLAVIGCANQGGSIGSGAVGHGLTQCVALCDVVPSRAEGFRNKMKGKCDDAVIFDDFREMFEKMGDKIDACTIGVPDHAHFPIAMLAMSLGIHVYVEKPLAHTFEECELLMAAEKKYGVMCQMGNQGHSSGQRLQFQSWVEEGVIKNVRRVDACMNKGRRWHPWGDIKTFPAAEKMPAGMNWDVWAGTAPKRPYNGKYDPGNWRGWYDYGNGAFGDWGPHTLDTIHRFLKLDLPHTIRAEKIEMPNEFIYPHGTTIAFDFPERGPDMPEMTINWYDGVKNRPASEEGVNIPSCGKAIYSDDLTFVGGTHSASLKIVGGARQKEVTANLPGPSVSKTSTNHMDNFLKAAAGLDPYCNSSFAIAARSLRYSCSAASLSVWERTSTSTPKRNRSPTTLAPTNSSKATRLEKAGKSFTGWHSRD